MTGVSRSSRSAPLGTEPTHNEQATTTKEIDPTSIPIKLTSGVELEFRHLQDTGQEWPEDFAVDHPDHGRKRIYASLSRPMTAECATCGRDTQLQLQINPVVHEGSQGSFHPSYAKWTVDVDGDIQIKASELATLGEDFQTILMDRIEVQSRVLDTSRVRKPKGTKVIADHECRVCADAEIRAVCDRLQEDFNSARGHIDERVVVHSSCGLHIHIGNGDKGFPLQTIKNLVSFCLSQTTYAEVRREGGGYRDINLGGDTYNIPWSAHFLQSAFAHIHGLDAAAKSVEDPHLPNRYPDRIFHTQPELVDLSKAFDVPSWLTLVDNASNIKDLRDLQGEYARKSTINLGNLFGFLPHGLEEKDRSTWKQTIEFRQAAGTLQADEVSAWHAVCVQLVKFAHQTPASEIRQICLRNWNHTTCDALDFLKLIGLSKSSHPYQHYKWKLGEHYAPHMREKERQAAFAFGANGVFVPIMSEFIRGRCDRMDISEVGKRIRVKFLAGGYGQFEEGYLKELKIKGERREGLMIGFRAREPEEELSEDGAGPGKGVGEEVVAERSLSWSEGDEEIFNSR
ncbi:Hypothetical predicted protein [Lecanosticta acicola]|uniref:Amidoligase enzyme-domain-containing protein n=1 Tax=Lecanosticta acicola TaxID=111012 RepID=A0AAI8YXQ4_9PEZI|nr:Hypothetical predicted protein [Lecanosticta acicola]